MFNELNDDSLDVGRQLESRSAPRAVGPTQVKFGLNYVDRNRDFESRRFRFIPIVVNKDVAAPINLQQDPEQLYTSGNIGTFFRFNEETRPVDAYDGEQTTTAGYGMVDVALSAQVAARRRRAGRALRSGGRRRSIRSASSSARSPRRTRTPTCFRA